ncbi:unnamed protein product [Rodentolepis nana]|uniref:DUF1907 domain-containing protein n=1 Tax=Rodentolepis nana TaxID=102285 RepID=A0A0R3TT67_RODNA|nr:unnamed protein product [Rodentolepis nana]
MTIIDYFSTPPLPNLLSCFQCGLPDDPVDTPEKVAAFVKHFEMEPPILGVGTLVSHDPVNSFGFDMTLMMESVD